MASTFTTNVGIEQPGNNDYVNTWSTPVNADWALIDQVLGTNTNVAFTNANVTLTVAQGAYFQVTCTGVLTANVSLIFPAAIGGRRVIANNCSGNFTLTVKNGAADPGVVVTQGLRTPILLTAGTAAVDNAANIRSGSGTIASAATMDLGSVPQGFLIVTGTTTVTSFGTSALVGEMKYLYFNASLTLTYNVNSLVLPSAANIVTATGDTLVTVQNSAGAWIVLAYQRANGLALVAGAGVTSFNGRQNVVVSAAGDYTTAQLNTATTASAPPAATLGETISSTGTNVGIGISPQTNVANVTLTAGHWRCFASLSITNSSQATTSYGGSISLNSGAFGSAGHQFGGISIPAGNTLAFAPPDLIVRTTGTTVYLGAYNGSTGGATATGTLTAIRTD